jgi:hypothetical protein
MSEDIHAHPLTSSGLDDQDAASIASACNAQSGTSDYTTESVQYAYANNTPSLLTILQLLAAWIRANGG